MTDHRSAPSALENHQIGVRPTLPVDQVIGEFGFHYFNDLRSWQHTWLGRPVMQNPHDIWAIQQIMWRTKPEVVVETGTQHGGSCILWRWLLEACGGGDVITIDVDHSNIVERDVAVHYLTGSSIDPGIIGRVAELVAGRPALVILDSDHAPPTLRPSSTRMHRSSRLGATWSCKTPSSVGIPYTSKPTMEGHGRPCNASSCITLSGWSTSGSNRCTRSAPTGTCAG